MLSRRDGSVYPKEKNNKCFSVHYAAKHSGETKTGKKILFNPERGLEFSISIEIKKDKKK